MTDIRYIQSTERQVGEGHPVLDDTLNRALKDILTASGLDPDADFGGFFPAGNLGVYNVKQYGAAGDASTNDTLAVAAAFAAVPAEGGVVLFPPGTYIRSTNTKWTVKPKTIVMGVGADSIIQATGTEDVFYTEGDDVRFYDLTITGPSNTSCDGIAFEGADRGRVARVQGTLLASTVTVGLTVSCDDVQVKDVTSTTNTQQGVHFNKVTNGLLKDCYSTGVGSTNAHHGFYIGNCTDVQVVDCRANACYGSGVHVYPQAFAGARISVIGGQYKGNGLAASGLRAGVLAGCDATGSLTDVLINGANLYGNAEDNLALADVTRADVRAVVSDGGGVSSNGLYLEVTKAGNYSASFLGCRVQSSAVGGSGIRLSITTGTVQEVIIDDCLITDNGAGIYATGAQVQNLNVGPNNTFRDNTPSGNLVGTFVHTPLGVFNVKDFGATGDGTTDDSAAIQAALTTASTAGGGVVELPPGLYLFSTGLTVGAQVTLRGRGYATNSGDAERAPACLLKSGAIVGVSLTGAGAGLENIQIDGAGGNTNDGIVVGAARCVLRNVSVTRQGGAGVTVGIATTNCNLWRIDNLLTIANGSHGLYITDPDASAPDVNGGILVGLDSRSNGGDGLLIDNAYDNNYFGVSCQSNTGYGVRCLGVSARKCQGQTFWFPYTESNVAGEILLDTYSYSCVVFGYRTGGLLVNDAIVNSGASNLVLGHYGSIKQGPLFRSVVPGSADSPLAAELFRIIQSTGAATSGYYDVYKDGANRNLVFQLNGTSATPVEVTFDHGNASGHLNLTLADGHITQYVDNPSALAAGNNNNYVPGEAATLLVTCDATGSTITGIQVNTAGRRLRLINVSAFPLTIAHQNAGTTPSGYRIITATGADVVIAGGSSCDLEYDSVTARWRLVAPLGVSSTQAANDNSTKIATTAYVDRAPGSGNLSAAAPTGTTSATAVMMGVNSGASIITPTKSGRVVFTASCQMANNTVNDGVTVDLRTGTGTGPANGAAVTGTQRGVSQTKTSLVAADRGAFSASVVVTGLTIGQAYWADLSVLAVTGGTASVTGVMISAYEF